MPKILYEIDVLTPRDDQTDYDDKELDRETCHYIEEFLQDNVFGDEIAVTVRRVSVNHREHLG